jgi:hypothetical protein
MDSSLISREVCLWPIAADIAVEPNVGFRGTADIVLSGAPSKSVANDRAARLAAIPAGESPANRGVQSLL